VSERDQEEVRADMPIVQVGGVMLDDCQTPWTVTWKASLQLLQKCSTLLSAHDATAVPGKSCL
jgi:hypothetical protein